MRNIMPGGSPGIAKATLGLLSDILAKTAAGRLTHMQLERITKGQNPFGVQMEIHEQQYRWERLYFEFFKIKVDLKTIPIPRYRLGFDRLIYVPQGFDYNRFARGVKGHYGISINFTQPDHDDRSNVDVGYCIRVRDRMFVDDETLGMSAKECDAKKIKGQTLLEASLHDLMYSYEYRYEAQKIQEFPVQDRQKLFDPGRYMYLEHLQGKTICSGSHNKGESGVPVIYEYDDGDRCHYVALDEVSRGYRQKEAGIRQVLSC